jgi:hypothetical protein
MDGRCPARPIAVYFIQKIERIVKQGFKGACSK